MRYFILLTFCALAFSGSAPHALKPKEKFNLKVPEPSDIAYSAVTNSYFIASDQGMLYEVDAKGKILRKCSFKGVDFEGVYTDDNYVYVSEEMTRDVLIFDIHTLEKKGLKQLHYNGGRNKGFEAITYNPDTKKYIMVTEKDPIWIFQLDENFIVSNRDRLKRVSDISSVTYYNKHIWMLSDEDHCVMMMDPDNFKILRTFKLNILNPEGICFNDKGELIIVSDDMQMMFNYGPIEN